MANKKISALAAATAPLSGTELVPAVQGGVTTQVSITNLTAGRPILAYSFLATNGGYFGGAVAGAGAAEIGLGTNTSGTSFLNINSSGNSQLRFYNAGVYAGGVYSVGTGVVILNDGIVGHNVNISVDGGSTNGWSFNTSSNLVPNVTGRGINFTANTPAAGMTSQLLNWYEEGTWTPTDQSGASLSFTVSDNKYTRTGRQVICTALITYPTTADGNSALIGGLPFTIGSYASGLANLFTLAVGTVTTVVTGTSMYVRGATGAIVSNATLSTLTISVVITYFI